MARAEALLAERMTPARDAAEQTSRNIEAAIDLLQKRIGEQLYRDLSAGAKQNIRGLDWRMR